MTGIAVRMTVSYLAIGEVWTMRERFCKQIQRGSVLLLIAVLLSLPVIVWFSIDGYYSYYDELALRYECYPFEKCQFDLNGDNLFDRVETAIEPKQLGEPYHSRLKIWVKEDGIEREILNIENVLVDGTFRTHLAFAREDGINKIIIYDTVNLAQFFKWNNSDLAPTKNPTELELSIRKAMGLKDDTGGFHTRIFLEFGIAGMSVMYYFFILLVGILIIYLRRRSIIGLP